MLILECGRLDTLRAACADNCPCSITVQSLCLARIDKSDTLDGNLRTTISGDEPWGRIEDEWIKESICVVVTCVTLPVGRDLHLQDVWLGVLRHFASDELGAAKLTFDVDVLVWVVTEAALKVRAGVVEALEAGAAQLHSDALSGFNMAIAWRDSCDVW